jgi:hypothetical protein
MTGASVDNDHYYTVSQQQEMYVMSEIRQLHKKTYLYFQTKIYSLFSIDFPLSFSVDVFRMLSYVLFFFLYFKDRPIFYSYSFSLFSPTCYMTLVPRMWIPLRSPNLVVERLPLLLRIRKVPGSILGSTHQLS